MSDEEAHRKKEAEKGKEETWGQTQKVIEKKMSDEKARHKREAEKAKEDKERAYLFWHFEVSTWILENMFAALCTADFKLDV